VFVLTRTVYLVFFELSLAFRLVLLVRGMLSCKDELTNMQLITSASFIFHHTTLDSGDTSQQTGVFIVISCELQILYITQQTVTKMQNHYALGVKLQL